MARWGSGADLKSGIVISLIGRVFTRYVADLHSLVGVEMLSRHTPKRSQTVRSRSP